MCQRLHEHVHYFWSMHSLEVIDEWVAQLMVGRDSQSKQEKRCERACNWLSQKHTLLRRGLMITCQIVPSISVLDDLVRYDYGCLVCVGWSLRFLDRLFSHQLHFSGLLWSPQGKLGGFVRVLGVRISRASRVDKSVDADWLTVGHYCDV